MYALRFSFSLGNLFLSRVSAPILRGKQNFSAMSSPTIKFLNQQEAICLDEELMGECNYKLEQLMELAGLR